MEIIDVWGLSLGTRTTRETVAKGLEEGRRSHIRIGVDCDEGPRPRGHPRQNDRLKILKTLELRVWSGRVPDRFPACGHYVKSRHDAQFDYTTSLVPKSAFFVNGMKNTNAQRCSPRSRTLGLCRVRG